MTTEQYRAMIAGQNQRKPKYGNRKVEYDGREFDSERERDRYAELKILERAEKILDLHCQEKFELIPNQKDTRGKVIEKAVNYYADFTYWKNGRFIVEDTKGFSTTEYRIKRKLMLFVHGIRVVEV